MWHPSLITFTAAHSASGERKMIQCPLQILKMLPVLSQQFAHSRALDCNLGAHYHISLGKVGRVIQSTTIRDPSGIVTSPPQADYKNN